MRTTRARPASSRISRYFPTCDATSSSGASASSLCAPSRASRSDDDPARTPSRSASLSTTLFLGAPLPSPANQFGDRRREKRFERTPPDAEYKQATLLDQEFSAASRSRDAVSYREYVAPIVGDFSAGYKNAFYEPTASRLLVFDVDGYDDAPCRTAPTRHEPIPVMYAERSVPVTRMTSFDNLGTRLP